jgi:hypothetical protein
MEGGSPSDLAPLLADEKHDGIQSWLAINLLVPLDPSATPPWHCCIMSPSADLPPSISHFANPDTIVPPLLYSAY